MEPPLKTTAYCMFTTLRCFVVLEVSNHSASSTTGVYSSIIDNSSSKQTVS